MGALLLRLFLCGSGGALCAFAGLLWAGYLLKKRGREYTLSRGGEAAVCAGALIPGGAVGLLTGGFFVPLCCLLLIGVCVALSVTDATHRIIPNPTVLAILLLKAAFGIPTLFGAAGFLPFNVVRSLIGFAVCFVLFSLPGLFGRHVGAGDVKLAAACGFFLGIDGALIAVTVMGLLVILFGILQRRTSLPDYLRSVIPMGPFIAAGTVSAVLIPFLLP